MDRFGLDALVAYSKENVAYGTGYTVPSQSLGVRNRQFAVAINRDGRVAMLLTTNELQEAQARSTIQDLRPYDEFREDPMAALADILRDLGVADGVVGLEMDAIPAGRWEDLTKQLPGVRWQPGTQALERARMVKTPREVEHLREAARIADLAQLEAHASVFPGMTEQELYRVIVDRALLHGIDTVLMVQVAAGERSSYSNPTPTLRPMQMGDVVKIDVFMSSGGYLSDTGRAIVIGEATEEQREIWAHMQEALAAIYMRIRPGTHTKELWEAFTANFGEHNMLPAIRFLGHGLGLSLHEEPFITADSDIVLEPGMVFAIEPVYRVGDIGFHLEDNVLVTENGMENMTRLLGSDLIVLGSRVVEMAQS